MSKQQTIPLFAILRVDANTPSTYIAQGSEVPDVTVKEVVYGLDEANAIVKRLNAGQTHSRYYWQITRMRRKHLDKVSK